MPNILFVESTEQPKLRPWLHGLKKLFFSLSFLAILFVLTLLLLEALYRLQWFGFYSAELKAYNPPEALADDPNRPTLLVLGDSFTAGNQSYPNLLRQHWPGWRVINGGVSGTGIVQTNLLAPGYLRRFKPEACIYQLFVGNDLFDIRYMTEFSRVNWIRRIYWTAASHFRFLGYLNYRLGQLFAGTSHSYERFKGSIPEEESFSPDKYNMREKLYITSQPTFLEDHIRISDARRTDYERLLLGLDRLRASCRESGAELILLVIPHAAQVSREYQSRMQDLGAEFVDPGQVQELRFPFYEGIRSRYADCTDVRVINALPALQNAERNGERMYLSNDGHLNTTGQRQIANILVRSLSK